MLFNEKIRDLKFLKQTTINIENSPKYWDQIDIMFDNWNLLDAEQAWNFSGNRFYIKGFKLHDRKQIFSVAVIVVQQDVNYNLTVMNPKYL